jgi:hypothetical protein
VFVVTVVMTFIYVDRFVAAIGALPAVLRAGEPWALFWEPAAIMLAAAPLNLIRPWAYVAASRRACKAVFTARAAAVAGDAELAPVASEQPDPQQSDHSASALAAIGPLRRSTGSRATTQLASCIALLVFGGLLTIATVAVLFTVPSGTTKNIGLLVLVGLTAGILGAALLLALVWRRERWVVVRAGDTGLSWTESGVRRRQMDAGWHEIQAFVKVRFRTATQGNWQELYALDAQRTVLAWYIKSTAPDSEREAHALLSGLVASHTALQLRDLTDTIEKLEQPVSESPTTVSPVSPAGEVGDLEVGPTAAGSNASCKVHWGHVAATALSLPALLLAASGWALQQYQPHYYAWLDARIHAEQPLYSDRLNAVDGDWLVRQPTKSDARTYTYNNHTYQLSGKDASQFMDAWPSRTFGDVAVEVTVQQIGTDQPSDGVGLELRGGEDPQRMVVFMVDSTGFWYLWNYKYIGDNSHKNWDLIVAEYSPCHPHWPWGIHPTHGHCVRQ